MNFVGPITLNNFATAPVGVALVWALMFALDQSFAMSTRAKVLIQIIASVVYSAVAAGVFMEGTVKGLIQQGIILFCAVCFTQMAAYETVTKVSGFKGDKLPFTFFKHNYVNVSPPAPVVVPVNTNGNVVAPVQPEPLPADGESVEIPPTNTPPNQGSPDGRI
jgi:hypothetical protein